MSTDWFLKPLGVCFYLGSGWKGVRGWKGVQEGGQVLFLSRMSRSDPQVGSGRRVAGGAGKCT